VISVVEEGKSYQLGNGSKNHDARRFGRARHSSGKGRERGRNRRPKGGIKLSQVRTRGRGSSTLNAVKDGGKKKGSSLKELSAESKKN